MTNRKTALLKSFIALLLCFAMLIGSTYAWFTDSVTSSDNVIQAGNLNVEMYWTDDLDSGVWYNVEDDAHNTIFSYDNWEPGYTDVKYVKIVNKGNLALNYQLTITPKNEVGKLAEVINVYFANEAVDLDSRDDLSSLRSIGLLEGVFGGGATAEGTLLTQDQYSPVHPSGEVVMTIAMNMIESAGNDYQGEESGEFTITALATQAPFEEDSFGSYYDALAEYPVMLTEGKASAAITAANGVLSSDVVMSGNGISAFVPAGTLVEDGADKLTLTVTPLKNTTSGISIVNKELLIPVDVHIDGVSEDNTSPIVIDLGAILPKYMNMGNYHLYHVEDGVSREMTLVSSESELTAHNRYTYDTATGEVVVAMASFSEVALFADTANEWKGDEDYSWFTSEAKSAKLFEIANADQLYAFSKIVGGMAVGYEQYDFDSATVKLLSDVDLGGSNSPKIFYPIGYTNSTKGTNAVIYDRSDITDDFDGSLLVSSVAPFKGSFDGDGHTISNFYQNTWEMFGGYNDGYSGTPNYYKDAMGLFGYVNGGAIKNLTVDNFTSDGEYTPTGVIAAYAADATFENIAITNCNPRVYNTGNGGIVGIGGNTADTSANNALTFKNVTIDNTNEIAALWESYDVACGGIMGMLRGYGKVNFTNCHVAAKMNVYNDVCGNYQYYWYRYSGMMIGTIIGRNYTADDGYVVPDMTGITAEGCTVHFGEWNDYYYCELVSNSIASYTHDYQFSRLEQINSLSEIYKDGKWIKSGNFLLANGEDKTCYHIEYKNGKLTRHIHEDAGYEASIDENGDGQLDLVEDKQIVYLRFKQLFQGDGWGVKHVPIYDDGTGYDGITILDREVADSQKKFNTKFTGDFLYRVGNQNEITVGTIFEAVEGVTISNSGVWVSVEKINSEMNVSGTFTKNATNWANGKIKFSGTGIVKVTIQDYNYCNPTSIYLEVINAKNATSATSATSTNVVLLNNVGLSTLEVSNGYTLYGNGFKMEAKSDLMYDTMNAGFVILKNGTLDNVQIVCPNYSHAVVYNSNIKEAANTAVPSDSTNDARGNVRSAVMVDGNSTIRNSYVHGGRAAIFFRSGNLLVDNSTISGGAAANIHTVAAQELILRDVTMIQKPYQANVHDTSKTLMGFSGLFECGEDGYSTPLTLEGTLVQYAWINETYAQYTPSAASSIIDNALGKSEYLHDLDLDGDGATEKCLNLGFTYIPQNAGGSTKTDNVTDNRTNKSSVPYSAVDVGSVLASAKVYSYNNTNGTSSDFVLDSDYEYTPSVQGSVPPVVSFNDTNADRVFETKYDSGDGRWESTLTVDLDNGNYTFDFGKLVLEKNGVKLPYTVTLADGSAVDTSKTIALTSSGVTNYVITSVDGEDTHTVYFTISASKTSIPEPVTYDTTGGTPHIVVKSKNSDWSCAIPALDGIKIKYYTADGEVILDLASLTPTTKGKQNGTNNYWQTTKDGYTLKVTCGVIHDTKQVYGMPVVVDNNGTMQMYFTISSTSGYVSTGTSARAVTVTYDFTDPNGKTLSFQKSWTIQYASYKDVAQYSYSDFVNGTMTDLLTSGGGSSSCITPDTLITLADGTQVRVDALRGDELLLVWNLETGKYEAAPIVFIDSDAESDYEVIHLNFSDGREVKVISEHGFFDLDLGKYVYIDADNYEQFIGHRFVTEGDIDSDEWNVVTLDSVEVKTEQTSAYSPVTFKHLCYYTNGVLSMPGGIDGLFNIFDVDTSAMSYDVEKMAADIDNYGLFTLDDFGGMIPEIAYEAFNGNYLKVAIAKGLITWEDIEYLAERYVPLC